MMRGLFGKMEEHHKVRDLDEAIVECVKLSARYISGRQLPDKSVSVLDTTCAKVAIGQGATPASVEDATRRIQKLTSEIEALEREQVTGAGHDTRLNELIEKRKVTEEELGRLNEQWTKERDLTERIRNIRLKLEMTRLDAVAPAQEGGGNGGLPSPTGPQADEVSDAAAETASEPVAVSPPAEPVDTDALKAELKKAERGIETNSRG